MTDNDQLFKENGSMNSINSKMGKNEILVLQTLCTFNFSASNTQKLEFWPWWKL